MTEASALPSRLTAFWHGTGHRSVGRSGPQLGARGYIREACGGWLLPVCFGFSAIGAKSRDFHADSGGSGFRRRRGCLGADLAPPPPYCGWRRGPVVQNLRWSEWTHWTPEMERSRCSLLASAGGLGCLDFWERALGLWGGCVVLLVSCAVCSCWLV